MRKCRILFLGPEPPKHPDTLWLPLITLEPIESSIHGVLAYLENVDVVVLTSPRTPRILKAMAKERNLWSKLVTLVSDKTVVVVGPRTAEEVAKTFHPREVVVVEPPYTVNNIVETLKRINARRVLSLRSSEATTKIRLEGVDVVELPIYTVTVNMGLIDTIRVLAEQGVVIAVTSPAIAKTLCSKRVQGRLVSFYGPTAQILQRCGFKPKIVKANRYENVIKEAC